MRDAPDRGGTTDWMCVYHRETTVFVILIFSASSAYQQKNKWHNQIIGWFYHLEMGTGSSDSREDTGLASVSLVGISKYLWSRTTFLMGQCHSTELSEVLTVTKGFCANPRFKSGIIEISNRCSTTLIWMILEKLPKSIQEPTHMHARTHAHTHTHTQNL